MPAPRVPTYTCPRIDAPLVVDGDLRKLDWRRAPRASLRHATGSRAAVGQSTSLRACWCDTHLYLAFECADTDVWATHRTHDAALYDEEVVEAFLCPTRDVRRYYELEWNPLGVTFDASVDSPDQHRRTMQVDRGWECRGMVTAVRVTGPVRLAPPGAPARPQAPASRPAGRTPGWWVEVGIPFAAFPEVSPPVPGDGWRANFYRIDHGDIDEFTAWSPTMETSPDFHVPARFGHLVFGR